MRVQEKIYGENIMDKNTDWELILFYIFYRTYKQWEDFEKEIKYNNRYFPKSELLDEIRRIQNYAVCEIKQGDIFYRARLYNAPYEYCRGELDQITQTILKHCPDFGKEDSPLNISNRSDLIALLAAISLSERDNQPLLDEIEKIISQNKQFWGYSKEESDAPPKDKTPAGRANPRNISYLYIAGDIKTAMMEVRPNASQDVSIATIKILKDLKLFDFCYVDPEDEMGKSFDLSIISGRFSNPNFGGEDNYYATQYLCEFIKELGFDGIRFYSSLNQNGKNIVLFDTNKQPDTDCKNYDIIESKVYSITKLDLDYQLTWPFEQGDEPKPDSVGDNK